MFLPGADTLVQHGLVVGGVSGGQVLEESVVWSDRDPGLHRISLDHTQNIMDLCS